MAASLVPLIFSVVLTSVSASAGHDETEGCRGSPQTGFPSLLQARRGVGRAALNEAALQENQVQDAQPQGDSSHADVIDKDCKAGDGCSPMTGGTPLARAVCVVRVSGSNECWDACNFEHEPPDYQTGNVMLDIKVLESVLAIRNGSFALASCPSEPEFTEDSETQVPSEVRVPKGPIEDDTAEKLAVAAPLDEIGYKQVAALRSNAAMEAFIRRVVSSTGCRVADEPQLQGVIPYYSGKNAVQSYANLETEIYKACTGTGTWLSSLYPHSVLTGKDEATKPGTLGSTAPLSEQGFQEVLQLKDDLQMVKYVRRVVGMLHGYVVDESGLHGLLPFFTGEKGVQALGALILEIETAMRAADGWVEKASVSLQQVTSPDKATSQDGETSDEELLPATPLVVDGETAKRLDKIAEERHTSHAFQECPTGDLDELHVLKRTAWTVSLDDEGYEAMVRLKSDCAMMQYVLRIVQELHCHVLDESGLKGLVPFYSGTQGEQDIEELRTELTGVCNMDGKWLVPDFWYWAQQAEVSPAPTNTEMSSAALLEDDAQALSGWDAQPIALLGERQVLRSRHSSTAHASTAHRTEHRHHGKSQRSLRERQKLQRERFERMFG